VVHPIGRCAVEKNDPAGWPLRFFVAMLVFAVSALYATVGQAGGTPLLAVMAFSAIAPEEIRPTLRRSRRFMRRRLWLARLSAPLSTCAGCRNRRPGGCSRRLAFAGAALWRGSDFEFVTQFVR
jgi:hypothetical protein